MRCWNRYRVPGTIFDFGCTDSVGPELGKGLRHLIGAPPVAGPKVESWTGGQVAAGHFQPSRMGRETHDLRVAVKAWLHP